MFKPRFSFVLATIVCLSLPSAALALPPGSEPVETLAGATIDQPVGTTDPLFEDELDRVVKAAIAKAMPVLEAQANAPRVVYLQAPPAAPPPAPGTVLGLPFEQLVTVVATILVPLLLGLGTLIWKGNAAAKEASISKWIVAAYHITEEVSRLTPNTVDDKIAYALRVLTERLTAAGITPTAAIGEQARAVWTAMSGAEKVEASVRAKAVALAAEKAKDDAEFKKVFGGNPQTPLAGS